MTKKILLAVAAVAAVFVTALGVGAVYAQDQNPPVFDRGAMHGQLHTFMVEAFSAKLSLKVDDVNSRLAGGETLREIALSEGITADELPDFMKEVRSAALDAAVQAGVVTQDQADWMKSHAFGRGEGRGNGDCDGDGPHGQGRGNRGNNP